MKVEFVETEGYSDAQKEAVKILRATVYPPEILETLPGRLFTWASPQWSVLLWEGDELFSKVGLVVREVLSNNEIKTIGGIGGVMTHPAKQGQGLASQAMSEACKHFDTTLNVSFALLFCRAQLVEFYKKLSWKPFQGQLFAAQPQGKIEFSANNPMVFDIKENAPLKGVLDLNGLPW